MDGTSKATEASVKWVTIDLEGLYTLGEGPDVVAAVVLEELLKLFRVGRYEVVYNYSPDVGGEVLVDDRKFAKDVREAEDYEGVVEAVRRYAERVGATAVVELFDGYESAYAVVW